MTSHKQLVRTQRDAMTYPLPVVGVVDAADGRALAVHARARHAHLQREELVALQQHVDAYNNSSQS